MSEYTHIKPSSRYLADQPLSKRISVIMGPLWVDFPQARDVISVIHRMLDVPRQIQTPSLMVVAESGMGKTTTIDRLLLEQKRKQGRVNVLSIDATGMFTWRQFSESIGIIMGMPDEGRKASGVLISEAAKRVVLLRGYKGLIVDNLHDLLLGPPVEQRKNMGLLRELTNPPLSFSLIAFGTASTEGLMLSDSQLKKRFLIKSLDVWTESETLRSFLKTLEENLPLKEPSVLWDRDKVRCILSRTNGTTKEIVSAVKHAAVYAISSGREAISLDDLIDGAERPFEQENWNTQTAGQ